MRWPKQFLQWNLPSLLQNGSNSLFAKSKNNEMKWKENLRKNRTMEDRPLNESDPDGKNHLRLVPLIGKIWDTTEAWRKYLSEKGFKRSCFCNLFTLIQNFLNVYEFETSIKFCTVLKVISSNCVKMFRYLSLTCLW